jgi:hypothetical protein
MSNFLLLLLLACSLLLAQRGSEKTGADKTGAKTPIAQRPIPKPPVVKRHPDGRPVGVPLEAVKISEGAWRLVVKGVPVVYRTGPFGPYQVSDQENAIIQSRIDGKPIDNTGAPESMSIIGEEGDKLRFRSTGMFGPGPEWVRDKADLTTAEKAVWEKHKQAAKK